MTTLASTRARWRSVLPEVTLLTVGYVLYRLARAAAYTDSSIQRAFANGDRIIHLERRLGVFLEPRIHSWAFEHRLLGIASVVYVNLQTSVLAFVLGILFLRHRAVYGWVRNCLGTAMVVGVVGYVVMPTAPPRFFPEHGFTDPVASAPLEPWSVFKPLLNPYAAMPSLHTAFAVILSAGLWRISPHPLARVLAIAYPLLTVFVVVVTANHFLLDALCGLATACGSTWLAAAASAFVHKLSNTRSGAGLAK